jgi:hypothetical protein
MILAAVDRVGVPRAALRVALPGALLGLAIGLVAPRGRRSAP